MPASASISSSALDAGMDADHFFVASFTHLCSCRSRSVYLDKRAFCGQLGVSSLAFVTASKVRKSSSSHGRLCSGTLGEPELGASAFSADVSGFLRTTICSIKVVLDRNVDGILEDLETGEELRIHSKFTSPTNVRVPEKTTPGPKVPKIEKVSAASHFNIKEDELVNFLLQHGFSSEQVEKLVKKICVRRLDGITIENIDSLVQFLKSLGMDAGIIYRVFSRFPGVLGYSVDDSVRRRALYLTNFGLDQKTLIKLILAYPGILVCSFDYLHDHLIFVESFSGSRPMACKVVKRYPLILTYSIERNLQPKLEFFASLGIPGEFFGKCLVMRPQVFGLSVDANFVKKMDFLVHLGFERNSTAFFKASFLLSTLSCEVLQSRFNHLMDLGLSHDEVIAIVRRQPDILGRRKEELLKKIDYLLNVMHRPLRELVKFPAFLSYSLEKRIKHRYEVLSEWKAKGALGMDYTLASILVISNRDFSRKFVDCPHERLLGKRCGCGGRRQRTEV